ncbi:MAG: carboxypeptidase regulatory-like domain-containing protein [Bacteroidaceae bacterium]|nr:carboxypeptidase regulatory-like domain-containing protein [Bacteroidaceae bacterium]
MKINRLLNLVVTMLLLAVTATAQDVNKLYLSEMTGMKNRSLDMPVYLENTSSRIVAFQFDVKTPEGVTLKTSGNKADETRAIDHKVNVRQLSDGTYRVMMLSSTNKTVRANRGSVASIVASISDSAPLEENGVYPIILSNVVISDSLGNNVMTSFENGALRIGANPDFIVKDVALAGNGTVNPKDSITVSWTVQNQGAADALGGFREQVYLVSSETGENVSLGTVYHNNERIASGATASFEHKFLVPRIVGLDGEFEVKVVLSPNNDSGERKEYQANNTTLSSGNYTMKKVLYLTNYAKITETDKASRYTYYIERSGSRVEPMTFPLSLTGGDSRLSISVNEATIAKGSSSAYIHLNIAGNTTLEGDVDFAIALPAANGYQAVESRGRLIDNELPAIELTPSKSLLEEGELFTITLTITRAVSEDLKVKLTCQKPALFKLPSSVTIPAGEKSVTIDAVAIDDDVVSEFNSVDFTASAEKHISGKCCIVVEDNDMPQLTMRLTPTIISEAAGPSAIVGVITRDKTNSDITIRLSDNSINGDIYYSTKRITLKRGQSRAEFSIGIVDNQLKEGDRDVEFEAAIYISSCNCLAGQTSGGYLCDTIHVVDNDGPALSITSKNGNILEGSENNVFTISRNDSPVNDLAVQVSSTGDGLTYPQTVTIPAGKSSVDINVALARNDVADDSRIITFKVSSRQQSDNETYASGTCWVMSTDQTLPDAMITSLNIVTNNVYAGDKVVVETEIYNGGYATLPFTTPLYYSHGNKTERVFMRKSVEPGETFVQRDSISSMDIAGNYYLQVHCDRENMIKEINDANNQSERCTLVLNPLFKATANVDKDRYLNSDTVYITGHVEGLYSRNADVEVYVKSNSTRNTIMARTDENGDYEAKWVPVGNQAGRFIVGACTVGENLSTEMDAFDVYGMRRYDSGFMLNELETGETVSNYLHLLNHGSLPLTGLSVTAEYNGKSAKIDFEGITSLQPGENGRITYTIEGLTPSEGKDWEKINIRIESAEGAVFEQTAYYYVRSSKPVLKASVNEINTTIIKGETRDYEIHITNQGRGETGTITVDLGNVGWLKTATPTKMPSMAQGDSAVVVLQMTPMAQDELNSVYKGNFVISCENGSSVNIRYFLEVVSESTGTLVIDVQDEFTLNTAEAPHVEGATVNVLHPVTQKLLRQYVTGADGLATFDMLPEGRYIVKVTHPKHSSRTMDVIVDPERTTKYAAFIEYSAITVEMKYEPTEIEDEYNIVTTVKYETNVPKPVVVLDIPDKIILDSIQTPYVFYATMTNVGLVTASQARFSIPEEVNGYYFSPLIEGPWDILPHQTITIPVEITKMVEGEPSRVRGSRAAQPRRGAACGIEALGQFFDHCAGVSAEQFVKDRMQIGTSCIQIGDVLAGIIPTTSPDPGPPGGGGKEIIGSGSGGASGGGGTPVVHCDPYLQNCGDDIIDGAATSGGKMGAWDAGWNFLDCGSDPPIDLPEIPKKPKKVQINQRFKAAERVIANSEAEQAANIYEIYKWEMDSISQCMRTAYIFAVAADKRKHLIEATPLFFCNDFFNEDAPLNEEISADLPSVYPSWQRVWLNNIQIPQSSSYHLHLKYHEIFGDWGFHFLTEEEIETFIVHYEKWVAEGRTSVTAADFPAMSNYDAVVIAKERLLERINNTLRVLNGEEVDGDYYIHEDYIEACDNYMLEARKAAQRMGYEDEWNLYDEETEKFIGYLTKDRSSTCATVTLQIEQKMTMTRQAVRGTLTVYNASESEAMKNVTLNLVVTDPYGNIADSHIMEIHTEEKTGFTGEDDFESGWELAPKETGVAKILFIPTKYAAPTEPLQYTFSGSISFIDPFTGLEMTRELEAERLTVNPSPNLELVYFMQRDIFGDDALTDEVEPIVPSQFSLLINNKGYGDATKVKMLTQQPKIIENEKGLLVDIQIESSQLNGGDKVLAMGESVATDFGTIPAMSQVYAQWWMTSSLTGHFVEYDVKATHVTSYDNPDLSLLDSVHIHELIHQIEIPLALNKPKLLGFLVNDEEDYEDRPDIIYMTDGETYPVYGATGTAVEGAEANTWELTIHPEKSGWCYGNMPDPTAGKQQIKRIVRKSDGVEIPLSNFWQTDRTLIDKLEPVYENLLHFADTMSIAGDSYTLYFSKKPEKILQVLSFSGVPNKNDITKEAVDTVTVGFNLPIDPATFTTDDIQLLFQGESVDVSKVKIIRTDDKVFKLYVGELTTLDGYYSLTVNTNNIIDTTGEPGVNGKMTGWIQVSDGKANFTMECLPEGAGVLTPGTSKQEYEGDVAVSAVANEGYRFLYWKSGDEIISEDAETVVSMFGPKTVTAVFQPIQYNVNIIYSRARGSVEGAGSGMFSYNQEIKLKATAASGYFFVGWRHEGEIIETDAELEFTVKGEDEYEAVFEPIEVVVVFLDENSADNTSMFADTNGKHYKITMNRKLSAWQWNPFCVPFDVSEQQINKTWGYATMIVQLTKVEDDKMYFTSAYNIKAGVPYLVKPERTVETPYFTYDNNIVVENEPIVTDYDGIQFAGNYTPHEWNPADEYYYGVKSNNIIKAKESTAALKGMRGYFVIPQGRKAMIYIGDNFTGISETVEEKGNGNAGIYNLQGVYLGNDASSLAPGIYIVNGQKCIVK